MFRGAQAVTVLILAAGTAAQQPRTWTNATNNGQWGTPANWDPVGVPGLLDTAVIQTGSSSCTSSGIASVFAIQAGGPLLVTGGGFTTATGGTMADFFGGTATLTSNGPLNFPGSSATAGIEFAGAGPYLVAGTMNVNGFRLASMLVNSGTMVQTLGSIEIAANHTLTNNGTFQVLNGGERLRGAGTFLNTAQVLYSGGALGHTGTGVTCRQTSGSTVVTLGTLGLGRSLWQGGTIEVGAQGVVQFLPFGTGQADFDGLSSIRGAGSVAVTAQFNANPPPVRILRDLEINLTGGPGFNILAGNTSVEARLTNRGLLTVSTSTGFYGPGEIVNEAGATTHASAGLSLRSGLIFQNKGQLTLPANQPVTLASGGTLVNEPGGGVSMGPGANAQNGGSGGRILNRGRIDLADGNHTFGVVLDQSGGEVRVDGRGQAASLAINAGGEWGGTSSSIWVGPFAQVSLGSVAVRAVEGAHRVEGVGGQARIAGGGASLVADGGGLLLDCRDSVSPASDGHFFLGNGSLGGPSLIQNLGDFVWAGGAVGVGNTADFLNLGRMNVRGGTLSGLLTNGLGGRVEQTAGFTIAATGAAVNNAIWEVLGSSGVFSIAGAGAFTNTGLFRTITSNSFTCVVLTTFINHGRVEVLEGTTLDLARATLPQFASGAWAHGGEVYVATSGELRLPSPCTRLAGTTLTAAGSSCPQVQSLGVIDADGSFTCNGDTILNSPLDCTDGGRLVIDGGATLTVPGSCDVGTPGTPRSVLGYCDHNVVPGLLGPPPGRIVTPVLNNRGFVRPGGPGPTGPMEIAGDFEQFPTGHLEFDLAGVEPGESHDQLRVTGRASLGGTIRVRLAPGFEPALGQAFVLLTAAEVAGAFDTVETPTLPGRLTLEVVASPARVVARVVTGCYPDCDTSTGVGVLDIFDFLCFQNRYDAGVPYACDCDATTGPGVCDIFDFLCFQNAYDAGCP